MSAVVVPKCLTKEIVVRLQPDYRTREPLLQPVIARLRLSAEEELDLFLRDRAEHVETEIGPALAAGKIVIVDRYYFSTVAYQGARGLDPAEILARNEAFAPKPDLLVVLDVEPAVGLQRIGARGDTANAFENEANLRVVADQFQKLNLPYMIRVDGTLPPERITEGILEVLYSGPLASTRRPVESIGGRAVTNGDHWTEFARLVRGERKASAD